MELFLIPEQPMIQVFSLLPLLFGLLLQDFAIFNATFSSSFALNPKSSEIAASFLSLFNDHQIRYSGLNFFNCLSVILLLLLTLLLLVVVVVVVHYTIIFVIILSVV